MESVLDQCYRVFGSCPFHFMTCSVCPFSAAYREEFSRVNYFRSRDYVLNKSIYVDKA